ncbi:hypothetical protein ILUMI_04721 [Ignelater luminosus]|uniref:Uncharacterized protein n=1 Tax=Ignelater luminosus TaxID=2038154 RepID=A0A8K0GH29_IGNLU|nr:hypothetical protein ILUMI_04721 [Ignelater luminosus]
MRTTLAQAEACLNSRPLIPLTSETDLLHISVLTPAHFLVGEPLTAIPEPDLTHWKRPPPPQEKHTTSNMKVSKGRRASSWKGLVLVVPIQMGNGHCTSSLPILAGLVCSDGTTLRIAMVVLSQHESASLLLYLHNVNIT